jgi:hypothetical protein
LNPHQVRHNNCPSIQLGGTDICTIWPYHTHIATLRPSANLSPVPIHLGW